jgi:PAS domain S-box-containing protein
MSLQELPAASEHLFRYLFEQVSLGIAVEDLEGTIVLANPALASMLGYRENELQGMNCSQFADGDDANKDWALFQQLRSGTIENYSLEKSYSRKDGVKVWGRLNVSLLKNGNGSSPLVFALVEDISERKRAETSLRQREADLSEAQRLAKVGSWQWDPPTDTVTWSRELYLIAGRDPSLPAVSYKEHSTLYTAESWERLRQAVEEALQTGKPYELDLEMIRADGTRRWLIARGEARRDPSGNIVQLRGTVQDITERKHANDALASWGRRLIEAQEQERTRVARDLHDHISQRVALLAIQLEQLKADLPSPTVELLSQLDEIRTQTSLMATEVQTLSHGLHSPKLEYLGIVAAMKDFCAEFSDRQKVKTTFTHKDVPRTVPKEISLCLFRILQEALQNALKHSGVRRFEVGLHVAADWIELTVRDSGVGFDPKAAMTNWGLGLVSMHERLQLVEGTLSIDSQPKRGTRIHARVPLSVGRDAMQAAG